MFQPSYSTMLSSDQNQQTAHGQSPPPKRNARRILACCAKLILLLDIIATATKVMTTMVSAKACVETEENTFLCTEDTRKAQRSTRKTYKYYLEHFGIPQMIEGNEEEMRKMKIKNSEMEGYFKGWIGRVNGMKGGERLKERWYVKVCFVLCTI